MLEVFSGSCRVTQACREAGLQADAVDHKRHSLAQVEPILADLTSDNGRRLLRSILSHPNLCAVFWAPPCGAASAAREIPLNIANAPRRLRSTEFPDGLSNLTPFEQAKVASANILYDLFAEAVLHTRKRAIVHVVENPRSSLFWRTTPWRKTQHLFKYTAFSACAYGSRRPKMTALAYTHEAFARFNKGCPGPSCRQKHLP